MLIGSAVTPYSRTARKTKRKVENLNLFLYADPQNRIEKQHNKETELLAETIRAKRVNEAAKDEAMKIQPQYITNAAGEKISVVLSLDDYKEMLEDLEDLAAIAERKDEPILDFDEAVKALGYDV